MHAARVAASAPVPGLGAPTRRPLVAPWAPTPVALRVRELSCRFLSSLCLFEKSGSSARPFDNRALAKNSATVPEMLILRLVNSYLVPRRRAMRGCKDSCSLIERNNERKLHSQNTKARSHQARLLPALIFSRGVSGEWQLLQS